MDNKELSKDLETGIQTIQNITEKLIKAMSTEDQYKELAARLNTAIQTPQNIAKILSEAFANMEGGGATAQIQTFYGEHYQREVIKAVTADHTGKLYAMIGEAYHSADPKLSINGVNVVPIDMGYNNIGYAYFEGEVKEGDIINFTYTGNGGGSTNFIMLIVIA